MASNCNSPRFSKNLTSANFISIAFTRTNSMCSTYVDYIHHKHMHTWPILFGLKIFHFLYTIPIQLYYILPCHQNLLHITSALHTHIYVQNIVHYLFSFFKCEQNILKRKFFENSSIVYTQKKHEFINFIQRTIICIYFYT